MMQGRGRELQPLEGPNDLWIGADLDAFITHTFRKITSNYLYLAKGPDSGADINRLEI